MIKVNWSAVSTLSHLHTARVHGDWGWPDTPPNPIFARLVEEVKPKTIIEVGFANMRGRDGVDPTGA